MYITNKVKIKEFVVTNDPYGMLNDQETFVKSFEDFDTALKAYDAIDNCYDKRITIRSNEAPPSHMVLLQVNNGIETCFDIKQYSPSGKWVTNETVELEKKAQRYLNNKEIRITYCVPALQRFFEVQCTPHDTQSHYRIYDKDLTAMAEGTLNLDKYPDIQDTIALARTIATTNTNYPYAHSVVCSHEMLEKEREKKVKERSRSRADAR